MSKRYGLVIDLDRCMGCMGCRIACKLENDLVASSGIRVDTIGGPHVDTPAGKYPNLSMYYIPVPCMHCDDPLCMDACPEEAIYKRPDGIVILDEDKCTGCQLCFPACPYDALTYDDNRDRVVKCTLCHHRVDEGLEPFCMTCCEAEAIFFGDLNDPESKVSKRISRRNAYNLKPEAGTGPAVYYCPEVKQAIV